MELPSGTMNKRESVVVDTNIIVAAILREGTTREIIFSVKFEIISPEQTIIEIERNKPEFLKKKGMTPELFNETRQKILENIRIIPEKDYGSYQGHAEKITPFGHHDDWPFIALTLKLNCPLWSNDTALKQQKVVLVYTTAELFQK